MIKLKPHAIRGIDGQGFRCIGCLDCSECFLHILGWQIDLSAHGEFFLHFSDHFAKVPACLTHELCHNEPWDHTGVTVREVTEEMMGTVFSSINAMDATHGLLHESMSPLRLDGHTSIETADFFRIPEDARIVNDDFSGMPLEKIGCKQSYHVAAFYEFPVFIDEEAAVKVSVPGDPEICFFFEYLLLEGFWHSSSIGFGTP